MTQRIVVVGSGFAGLWSAIGARRLITSNAQKGGPDVEVVVIAPEPRLVIRPRLYEADAASLSAPLETLFHTTGVKFSKGMVQSILPDQHEVSYLESAGTKTTVTYDKLILAAGSHLVRPDIPGLSFSFDVDQIEAAIKLEAHLKSLASIAPSKARNTVVVCGGGFTGLELATELPARLKNILGQDAEIHVILIDRGDETGDGLGPNPRPVITQALKELGVQIKLGASVTAIDAGGIILASGERLDTLTAVWTAGVTASELNKQVPGEKDNYGRLHVDKYLRTLSGKDIFATGDAAHAATDDENNFTMMSCQHAIPLGKSAGHNAAAELLGIDMIAYCQPEYVTCLDLGSFGAVFCEGWDRQVLYKGLEAQSIKQIINRKLIYPPKDDADSAFAGADPILPDIPFMEQMQASM